MLPLLLSEEAWQDVIAGPSETRTIGKKLAAILELRQVMDGLRRAPIFECVCADGIEIVLGKA
jgi:hypothetical protein